MADKKRNIGIVGAPDSGVSEVFAAILRHSYTPSPWVGAMIPDASNIDLGEYGDSAPESYNPKKRDKLDVFDKGQDASKEES